MVVYSYYMVREPRSSNLQPASTTPKKKRCSPLLLLLSVTQKNQTRLTPCEAAQVESVWSWKRNLLGGTSLSACWYEPLYYTGDKWGAVSEFNMADYALVSNGWNEWLTKSVRFVGVVGAVGLLVTEPGLGDAGLLVVTVKLPNVTQDGFLDGMKRGGKGGEREKRCSMRWW